MTKKMQMKYISRDIKYVTMSFMMSVVAKTYQITLGFTAGIKIYL